jgi:hypothetical protein
MHIRSGFRAVFIAICALSVIGAILPVVRAQVAQPAPKTYAPGEVHISSTRIYVHVFKSGLGHEHAVVGMVKEGVIHLGAERDAGFVVADLTSFVADPDSARQYIGLPGLTDSSTQQKVTANMLGPDVLNVQRYPTTTARFQSAQRLAQPSPRGLVQYKLVGDLTLHDKTRPLSVIAEVEEKDGWVCLHTRWSLLQSDFGMKPYTMALGAIGVADRLDFFFEGYLAKES